MQPFHLPGETEINRWAELLDWEAKLITPATIPIVLTADLGGDARTVAEDIGRFLGLRDKKKWRTHAFTYTRRFCQARTGLTEARARSALRELVRRGVIVQAGHSRRATTYELGIATGASAEDLVSLIIYEFGAVELPPHAEATS